MARRCGTFALALVCAMLIVVSAMAQPPGGRRGGGPGGFGGGMMGGPGGNLLGLLRSQDVQNELQLTTDQKDKLQDAAQSMGNMRERMQGLQDLSQEERRAKMQEIMTEMQEKTEKQLAEILQPAQLQRLKEIRLQVIGAAALALPEVAKALDITAEQTDKLKAIQQQMQDKMREAMQGAADLSQEERMAKMRETMQQGMKDGAAKALEVLTPQQKEAFEKLKGKKIDIDLSTLMPQGQGPGR
jgi:hypothetical protein